MFRFPADNKISAMAREELIKLLEISSETGAETELLAYLENRCTSMGLQSKHQQVTGIRYNLLVNPSSNPNVIYVAHADTVPETIEGNTCQKEVTNERLYGRGAADVKGGITALLVALKLLSARNVRTNDLSFTVAFTVDEEQEGHGSEKLATEIRAHSAVVIEPTDLDICIAQSGSVESYIRVHGEAAHGGEFEHGNNAILKAIEFLEELKNLPIFKKSHPLIGSGGFNVQMIEGGSIETVVPNRCDIIVDFRVLPDQKVETVQKAVDELAHKFGDIDSRWRGVSGAYFISAQEPVVQLLKNSFRRALGTEPRLSGIPSWTDAENLYSAGITPIIFGPGCLRVSHTDREYIEINEIARAARVFAHSILHSKEFLTTAATAEDKKDSSPRRWPTTF